MKTWLRPKLKTAGILVCFGLFGRGLYLMALIDGVPLWYGWCARQTERDSAEMFVDSQGSRPLFLVPSEVDRTLIIDAQSEQVPKQLIETFWYCLDSCSGPTQVAVVTNEETPLEQRVYMVTKKQVGQIIIRGVPHVHQDNRMLAVALARR